jgi:hypothetical protein
MNVLDNHRMRCVCHALHICCLAQDFRLSRQTRIRDAKSCLGLVENLLCDILLELQDAAKVGGDGLWDSVGRRSAVDAGLKFFCLELDLVFGENDLQRRDGRSFLLVQSRLFWLGLRLEVYGKLGALRR